jgi:glutaminyl-peptide cyclotransferase
MRIATILTVKISFFQHFIKKNKAMRNSYWVLVLAILTLFSGGCDTARPSTFDGESAFQLAQEQMAFGPRIPGTDNHRAAGDWILSQLSEFGWIVEEQEFIYQDVKIRNLIGMSSKNPAKPPILLGAHYDTRPIADRDPSAPGQPVPGANDGASGVAVLLELARVLDPRRINPPLWLVFFDAEDSGGVDGWEWIVGSTYFANQLELIPEAVVIVDMVGDADLQLFYERNSDPDLREQIWGIAIDLGFNAFVPETKFAVIDDHTSFLRLGYPAIDIIDFDYPQWHTTQDTLDRISPESLDQVGTTLQTWLNSYSE